MKYIMTYENHTDSESSYIELSNKYKLKEDEEISDELINYIIKELGYSDYKYLGKGEYGVSYKVNDNKVVKLTKDISETKNAINLSKKYTDHIINYYDVRKVENTDFYSIVMDYVTPVIEYGDLWILCNCLNYIPSSDINIIKTYLKKNIDKYLEKSIKEYSEDVDVDIEDVIKSARNQKESFVSQIENLLDELKINNINSYIDLHIGNMGFIEEDNYIKLVFYDVSSLDYTVNPKPYLKNLRYEE